MSEQQQVTEEQFVLGQRLESLARQNAQQALRIADLEAQMALIQAKSQQQNAEDQPGSFEATEVESVDEQLVEH